MLCVVSTLLVCFGFMVSTSAQAEDFRPLLTSHITRGLAKVHQSKLALQPEAQAVVLKCKGHCSQLRDMVSVFGPGVDVVSEEQSGVRVSMQLRTQWTRPSATMRWIIQF